MKSAFAVTMAHTDTLDKEGRENDGKSLHLHLMEFLERSSVVGRSSSFVDENDRFVSDCRCSRSIYPTSAERELL